MIGGNINFRYNTWNGNHSYSKLEASALNMLNIATTTGSTESYNNDEIWYDKNDKNVYYTYGELINNIVGNADINKCMKIKNAAMVLLTAVNERFKQDAIHESNRGTLESGHNNYAIKLSEFYSTLDSALTSRLDTLKSAKMLESKSSKRQKTSKGKNKKKQRTRTKPKSKNKSRMGRSPHKPKKQTTRTKHKPKKQRIRRKPKK